MIEGLDEKYKDESIQVQKWIRFAKAVTAHIVNYVIPQYGDEGDGEPAEDYDARDCVEQSKRYLARFGKSQRKGEELRDLHKAAHWIQKAADRLVVELAKRQERDEKEIEDRWSNRRPGE